MGEWKVTTVNLPNDINNYEKVERFMNTKYTLQTEFLGEKINLTPGSIKQLGTKFIGGSLDDGIGDMYLVDVNKTFIGKQDHFRRRGTKDSWSMYNLPLKYLNDGIWNSTIPTALKAKINTILTEIYMASEFYATVATSGGSFGRGNLYSGKTDGAYNHTAVIPAENSVNIPEYTKYGIPQNTFTHSAYDKNPYWSFVKNSPIIKDMSEESKKNLIEIYTYLCEFTLHRNKEAYQLGQWLKLLDQGGFKYMVHKNYSGGVHVVEELQYSVIKIGSPPYYNENQQPIKTGAAIQIPACLLGLSDFEEVSIEAIRDWGIHFQLYSALKPGKAYILSRNEPSGICHYWTAPATIAGGFIYRPLKGHDCINYGCAIFPFGVSIDEQKTQGSVRSNEILPRCINCFTDNSATIGFTCNGHNHHFLCDSLNCQNTRGRFATGMPRSSNSSSLPNRLYKCPICRTEHVDFI